MSLLLSVFSVWKRNFCYFSNKKKNNLRLPMVTYRTHSAYMAPKTCGAITPFSALRVGSCVCFNVLMDNRQMKGTYSGSLCVNALVSRSLRFLPKSKPDSSLGVFCCHRCRWLMAFRALRVPAWNEWAQMLGVGVGGRGGSSMPCPWPDAPLTQDSCETVAPCVVALESSMSGA